MSTIRHLSVPAHFEQLAPITTFVIEAAQVVGFDRQQLDRIELAVDEACSNIIEHAYAGRAGKITIEIETVRQHFIKIVFTDTGKAFEPNAVPAYIPCTPTTNANDLKVGGLGLHLMRQTMDEVCFEFNVPGTRKANGSTGVFNRLTMMKRL